MTTAGNLYARVRRTYYPSGAMESDTTVIGNFLNPRLDAAKRGQSYSYDPAGRRLSMAWGMGPSTYSYTDFGALSSITNGSNTYRYTYTLQGQVDSLLLGTGVRERRTWDDDGRVLSRIRVSDSVALIVSDSLRYDKADHIIRAWQQAYNFAADSTRISYDGLGAVLAREQGNQFGTNVEEFRNDAFGSVTWKRNRRSAGLVNTAPYVLSYNPTGSLGAWNTIVSAIPGQSDTYDNLAQTFKSGRMITQDQVIRPWYTGIPLQELAGRYYYGADDKLRVVQRYSWRNSGVSDGTWEEYWYDALGRRVLTRVKRQGSTTSTAGNTGPLCYGASICTSFTERVWWDGDQSLVEERVPAAERQGV
ncbi:MAG TPA: hypothetical protein VM053_00030 [Gemmatimonadaceae bacterium]|nr:hypothetical protein [Gemmatimonadaceae bacterium]